MLNRWAQGGPLDAATLDAGPAQLQPKQLHDGTQRDVNLVRKEVAGQISKSKR